ncbi:MAG: 2-oxoglutaramate amidase [candidate division BRC1 bacterium ADurb.BinA364]|nr:MAG: 2-oxoglutaramate amidase [candidate division BRC1 bacterium ADurb.BinA364]
MLANWPARRRAHWLALLRARAIENQAYVAGVNRIGADPAQRYAGDSVVFDPKGKRLAWARSAEGCIQAVLDMEALRRYRDEFPALKDMRRKGF